MPLLHVKCTGEESGLRLEWSFVEDDWIAHFPQAIWIQLGPIHGCGQVGVALGLANFLIGLSSI